MTSSSFRNYKIRLGPVFLAVALLIFLANACTVKPALVQPGTIPKLAAPDPGAEEFGKSLFQELCDDYDLDSDSLKRDRLDEVFNHIAKAAEVDHLSWHIHLLNGPEIVDIRAVHGNYIFVWTGLLDAAESDDELAGLLACELSHTLALHTVPVEFTIASDVLFSVAELATSLGLMVASQGAVVISGHGWMKWAYVEMADLDPLDRVYSREHEREAAEIALFIISRTQYSPRAILDFWERVAKDETLHDQYDRFSRSLSPQERADMLKELILKPTEEHNKLARKTRSLND